MNGHRLSVGHLELREAAEPVRAFDRRWNERHSGGERNARRPASGPVLELLDDPLRFPCALGEHGHDLPLLAQSHGRLDGLNVALAAAHGKRPSGTKRRAEDRVEELDLRHEVQLSMWPEGKAEWPGIEVGGVVRREHEAALGGDILELE